MNRREFFAGVLGASLAAKIGLRQESWVKVQKFYYSGSTTRSGHWLKIGDGPWEWHEMPIPSRNWKKP